MKRERRLWVMLREPREEEGVPFRFWRLTPRIFGIEIIAVRNVGAISSPSTPRPRA